MSGYFPSQVPGIPLAWRPATPFPGLHATRAEQVSSQEGKDRMRCSEGAVDANSLGQIARKIFTVHDKQLQYLNQHVTQDARHEEVACQGPRS